MKVKALDTIEDVNQIPEPNGSGGYTLRTVVTELKAGDIVELDDAQAARLMKFGFVSNDLEAALLPHLLRPEAAKPEAVAPTK